MSGRYPRKPFEGSPLVSPLQQSVVYTAESPSALDAIYAQNSGFTYSREGHPNAVTTAAMIDALEGASGGVMAGSGMGAVSLAVLCAVSAGDHILGSTQLYGRSLRLLSEEMPRLGVSSDFFDPTDAAAAEAALKPNTKAMLVEVVANPTLRIADMEGLAELCAARGITLILDNTFTTPLGFRAFERGVDIVLHSVTKFLAGHSDAMLGWVAAKDEAMRDRLTVLSHTWGMTAAPFDCWLAERGLLSFQLRYERAQANAAALADALADMPGIARVVYPGRKDHPEADRAKTLLGENFGAMVSFELEGGRAAADAFALAKTIPLAPTLGDITTTVSHPVTSSHRNVAPETLASLGINEGFFRVSVGVEAADDIIAAFAAATDRARRA
ncbi:MAG: PLP-dependent transferase [Pseudomonadota bacterium]